MTCLHSKINYSRRQFVNRTYHLCLQCDECGAVVKQENKLWLKPDDIPVGADVLEFNEEKYNGTHAQLGLF